MFYGKIEGKDYPERFQKDSIYYYIPDYLKLSFSLTIWIKCMYIICRQVLGSIFNFSGSTEGWIQGLIFAREVPTSWTMLLAIFASFFT
jgi:hypothetical protein